jgi:beta-lactamase regulating signal transducer with metallopeptidase domain
VVVSPREIVTATPELASPIGAPHAVSEEASEQIASMPSASVPALADALVALWLLGAIALLVRSTASTRRLASNPSIGPALVGVLRPRLVLPADFETRFDAQERALTLAHEEVHRVAGHTVVNAPVEVTRCASWFNPLVHLAASVSGRIRARVRRGRSAGRPSGRRAYAQALLETQLAPAFLPLGCVWTSRSATHLRERIAMLGRAPLDRRSAVAGAISVVVLGLASGYAAWAQQPERRVTQIATPPPLKAVQTPIGTAESRLDADVGCPRRPAGTTGGGHHDRFIERARAGDIDIVSFGTTETEMWNWPDRSVWDRTLGGHFHDPGDLIGIGNQRERYRDPRCVNRRGVRETGIQVSQGLKRPDHHRRAHDQHERERHLHDDQRDARLLRSRLALAPRGEPLMGISNYVKCLWVCGRESRSRWALGIDTVQSGTCR